MVRVSNDFIDKTRVHLIHGFNSRNTQADGTLKQNEKLSAIRAMCAEQGWTFVAEDVDYHRREAIDAFIEDRVQASRAYDCQSLFIGTSLGGLMAFIIARRSHAKCALINPALVPHDGTLDSYRDQSLTNFVTGESYTMPGSAIDRINELKTEALEYIRGERPNDEWGRQVHLDLGDDVLDSRKTEALFEGYGEICTYEGGSHRFEHIQSAIPRIVKLANTIVL